MSRLLIIISVILLLGSCRKLVQDDFPELEKQTSLNALLCADSLISVYLTETGGLEMDTFPYIQNASVVLKMNDSSLVLEHIGNGIYSSDIKAKGNSFYECIVLYNKESTTASCTIPGYPEIRSVKLYKNVWLDSDGRSLPAIDFTLANNPNDTLFYEAGIIFLCKSIYDDEQVPYQYRNRQSIALFTNAITNDTILRKYIEFASSSWGSHDVNAYILEIRLLSRSAFEYLKSLELYELGRYPEFGSGSVVPYSLYSNIQNGRGIFGGYTVQRSDTLYENPVSARK